MVFFRTDGKKSLKNDFDVMLTRYEIIYESSFLDTSDQNGHSEKKGHLLAMKTRALRINVNMPIYFWPWIVQTACYLLNRTPMNKHG